MTESLQTQIMGVGNDKIKYKGALANFDELVANNYRNFKTK